MWVQHPAPEGGAVRFEVVPPLDQLVLPRRGEPLHEAIVMKLIALNKAGHAFVFWLVSVMALLIQSNLSHLHDWAQRLLRGLGAAVDNTGQEAGRGWLGRHLTSLLHLHNSTVRIVLITAMVYAVVETIEAIGLWKERRWAEYLTALATTGFLPFEIHELLKRVTFLRVTALVVNLALIVWLVYKKRLFGLRGGFAALTAANRVDWPAVLKAPSPAVLSP
jgi:uncharacterized membrane protein (DUF2068 family)